MQRLTLYIYTYIHVYTYIYITHIFIFIYVHIHLIIYTYTYTHIHIYLYVYSCINLHIFRSIWTYICMYTYTLHEHTYVCRRTRTHTHIYSLQLTAYNKSVYTLIFQYLYMYTFIYAFSDETLVAPLPEGALVHLHSRVRTYKETQLHTDKKSAKTIKVCLHIFVGCTIYVCLWCAMCIYGVLTHVHARVCTYKETQTKSDQKPLNHRGVSTFVEG